MNNDWPVTVPILGIFQTTAQNYDSPDEDGYPTNLLRWVEYSFPNHEHRHQFWTMSYKAYLIFEQHRSDILALMNISSELTHTQQWNTRCRIMWNVAMCLLGYTEGQAPITLSVYEYINSNIYFQKLEAVVGCRNGIYYPIAYYHEGKEVTRNRIVTLIKSTEVTLSKSIFNAEEETIHTQTRPITQTRSTYHRGPNIKRKPAKTTTNYRGNPAQRLLQAQAKAASNT